MITGMDTTRNRRVSRPSSNPKTWVTDSTRQYFCEMGRLLTTLDPEQCTVVGAIDWYAGNKLVAAG